MFSVFCFFAGAVLGFGVGFFVYHNNSDKASKIADDLKKKTNL